MRGGRGRQLEPALVMRLERLEHENAELARVQDNLVRAMASVSHAIREYQADDGELDVQNGMRVPLNSGKTALLYGGPSAVERAVLDGAPVQVVGETGNYIVQRGWTCTCPAFVYTKANRDGTRVPCKHIRRVR